MMFHFMTAIDQRNFSLNAISPLYREINTNLQFAEWYKYFSMNIYLVNSWSYSCMNKKEDCVTVLLHLLVVVLCEE